MYKYCPIYVKGSLPVMEEGDLFKITAKELIVELSLSESSIRKISARLVKLQIIEREGTRIAGEWIITRYNYRLNKMT